MSPSAYMTILLNERGFRLTVRLWALSMIWERRLRRFLGRPDPSERGQIRH